MLLYIIIKQIIIHANFIGISSSELVPFLFAKRKEFIMDKKMYQTNYLAWVKENPNYSPISIGEYEDGSEAWLKAREHGKDYDNPMSPDYIPVTIGGSTIARILGVSPFGSKMEAWVEKSKCIEPKYFKEKNASILEDGHLLEEWVAKTAVKKIVKETGADVEVWNDINMYKHPYAPFALANLDRRLKVNGIPGILECKTTQNWESIKKYWQNGICPPYYEYQCRWYMAIMNLSYCYIACNWMTGEDSKAVVLVRRDLEVEAKMMAEAAEFVDDCEIGREPSLDNENIDELSKYYTQLYGEIPEEAPAVELPDTPEMASLIQDIQDIFEEKKRLEDKMKDVEQRESKLVCEMMKVSGGTTTYASYRLDDETVLGIKLKLPMKRDSFDEEKLKETDEELYSKYLKTEEKFDVTKFKKENKALSKDFIIPGKVDISKPVTLKEITVKNIPV